MDMCMTLGMSSKYRNEYIVDGQDLSGIQHPQIWS